MTDAGTVHDALADRAFLHDDPVAYLAGVDDAVAEAVERDDDETQDEPSQDAPSPVAASQDAPLEDAPAKAVKA